MKFLIMKTKFRQNNSLIPRKELFLALKINLLERELTAYKIELENAATDQERKRKEKQIETKELLLYQLRQITLLPQQMQLTQQGNRIFLSFRLFMFSRYFAFLIFMVDRF